MCHATVTGVTGCNLRWGQDPGCTYKDKVVVVSVPHDGGWEDWWRGGMVRYTPGGTAPPLRLSPRRPPGVAQIIYPEEKNYPSMGRGMVIKRACYRAYRGVWEKGLKRPGCHPKAT